MFYISLSLSRMCMYVCLCTQTRGTILVGGKIFSNGKLSRFSRKKKNTQVGACAQIRSICAIEREKKSRKRTSGSRKKKMTNPIDMHKRSRVMQDAVCTLVPALRRYVFQYLVLFEVVELGWITRQWRPLAIDYAKNAVHIAIARYCDSKHSPTLGLRLLERHARSLRYLMLSHSAMCTPDDLGMLARIIRQNTATLRFVSAPNLETYLAACACPLLEDYCPERNGLSSTAFNKHTLYVTTVFCRNIQTLALHENQSDKLTVDTINDILSSGTFTLFLNSTFRVAQQTFISVSFFPLSLSLSLPVLQTSLYLCFSFSHLCHTF
jgi:hypothetical protein